MLTWKQPWQPPASDDPGVTVDPITAIGSPVSQIPTLQISIGSDYLLIRISHSCPCQHLQTHLAMIAASYSVL